jgi:hypothetical protein
MLASTDTLEEPQLLCRKKPLWLGYQGRGAIEHQGFLRGEGVKYPRVSYTDLDDLICKKSEGEVRSEAEGGEHSEEACAPTCPK